MNDQKTLSTDPKLPRSQVFANVGTGFGGIGALLAAPAAVIAAVKADDILDKILKIQTQTEEIKAAVLLLGQQIKANSAAQSVDQAQTSKGAAITDPATIDEILKKYSTMRPMPEPRESTSLQIRGTSSVTSGCARPTRISVARP